MGNGTHGQRDIMVNTADRDEAPLGMGYMGDRHMANGAHGQLDLTRGPYFCLEYLPWQGGYLPLQMGTYLGWGDTYLG